MERLFLQKRMTFFSPRTFMVKIKQQEGESTYVSVRPLAVCCIFIANVFAAF